MLRCATFAALFPQARKIIEAAAVQPATPPAYEPRLPIVEILSELEACAGVDFSGYRQPMIERRIRGRMIMLGLSCFEHYLAVLRSSADEVMRLIERLTIKVSRFYRYPPAFDCVRDVVLPALACQRQGAPIRIWSIGTGGGEEAYTLAMLLHAGGYAGTVEASDLDPGACETARIGIYPSSALVDLPAALAQRYLRPLIGERQPRLRVREELRPLVRFSVYDVTRPGLPPGEGCFDLVMCRNLLIYLEPATQEKALRHLRNVMSEDGFLCLGEAEWPTPALAMTLETVHDRARVFQARDTRVPGASA
jgi:two-component system CheB/CheR fusion protein